MRTMTIHIIGLIFLGFLQLGCSAEPTTEGRKVRDWVNLLQHRDWAVREKASETLARLGSESVAYLKPMLKATDPTMRREVVVTLGKIGPKAQDSAPALISRIDREEVAVIRAEILRALASIDPLSPKVQALFKKRLRDVDAEVRSAAQSGLELLRPKKPVENKGGQKQAVGPVNFELRDAVKAEMAKLMPNVGYAVIAELIRQDRRAALIWPGIVDGQFAQVPVMALIYQKKGSDGWVFEKEIKQGTLSAEQLSQALGGADQQQVIRSCGVTRERLADFVNEWAQKFVTLQEDGNLAGSLDAFEKLSQAFSFVGMAYGNIIPQMLKNKLLGRTWQIADVADKQVLSASIGEEGKGHSADLRLSPCGQGVVISGIEIKSLQTLKDPKSN